MRGAEEEKVMAMMRDKKLNPKFASKKMSDIGHAMLVPLVLRQTRTLGSMSTAVTWPCLASLGHSFPPTRF